VSATFVSPVATPIASSALQNVAPAGPIPRGRFAKDGVWWTGIAAGTAVRAFATGCVRRFDNVANGVPGASFATCTLFELSPLPQMDRTNFEKIPGGLPVQLVIIPTTTTGPASDDLLLAGDTLLTAPAGTGSTAYLAFVFQDRVCRDPLSWAEAIAASGAVDATWAPLTSALGALPGARTLRVLDHRGQPLSNAGGVTVTIGTSAPVTVNPVVDGDTGITVAATDQATVAFATAAAPVVAAVVAVAGADAGGFGAPLTLALGARLVQVLDAADWFAAPTPGVALPRWNANSLVEPIVEGTPYFRRLVADIRAANPGGAVQLAGWTFAKGSLEDATVEWPLVPGDDTTRLLKLVQDLHAAGVPTRFLVNQFLQSNVDLIDDAPWLLPFLLAAFGLLPILVASGALKANAGGFGAGMLAILGATIVLTSPAAIAIMKAMAESSTAFVNGLDAIATGLYTWTPYPAAFADNPLVSPTPQIAGLTIDDFTHVGVYHQKHVSIKHGDGTYVAYVGGIDINSDRVDTSLHRAAHPFHDVQLRISGPAVKDVIASYQERLELHAPGAHAPIYPPAVAPIPAAGSHLVQIARTYFKPGSASPTPPLPFAPNGESTPIRTIIQAIAHAKDFIYIEDQYFTPPDDYVQALLDAAAPARGVRALFVTVPYQTDQPYGWRRRADVLEALRVKWNAGSENRLFVGTPLRRFMHPTPALVTNLGRARLASNLASGDTTAELSPVAHLPPAPFFAFVGGELMLFYSEDGAPTGSGETSAQKFNLARGSAYGWGANRVGNAAGTPVIAVLVPGIYVHAKLMIVDDVFLFAGSSNLNRRGFYHDGEMDAFTIPQHLLGDTRNPARVLRSRLMAEHAGLTPEMGLSLFADPLGVIPYFARPWQTGSHRVPMDFFDGALPLGVEIKTSGSALSAVLNLMMGTAQIAAEPEAWKLIVDPLTSTVPPPPLAPGPQYP
jgi:phosphatidylserine/phosphatidylglycerophosphate/cardiolipin synthase-like enzyme